MSKLNIGVGEDFPLDDAPREFEAGCGAYWRERGMHRGRHWHHRHGSHRHHPLRGAFALVALPAAAASITVAVLYPLATLGVVGGLGLAAAAYRHGRFEAEEERENREPPADKPEPPTETPPKENM